jgi:glycosyltransferase involved in cell wall biosynthesis
VSIRRVLVIAQDRLGEDMAGTSIRGLELARRLADSYEVTLAGVGDSPAEIAGLPSVGYQPHDPRELDAPLDRADAVLSLPGWPLLMTRLKRSGARIVFDLYVPQTLEIAGGFPGARRSLRRTLTEFATDRVVDAARIGHQFICATEKQRDLWLGAMLAERLFTLDRYDADPSLRSLIDVVPFGVPDGTPQGGVASTGALLLPGVEAGDDVVLWNGGLWPWLDPFTAIRAAALAAERRPRLRLVFMGAATQLPAQRTASLARDLASELGVLNRFVFFNERWVPYDERGDWLTSASCAVSTHEDHVETRFAFRTRLLDCFWARLPVVCTSGDELAERIARDGLGEVVPPGDVPATAEAILRVLERGRDVYRPGLERAAAELAWSEVARPLLSMLTADAPPLAPPRVRRPGHLMRSALYRAGRLPLNLVGVREWPRL